MKFLQFLRDQFQPSRGHVPARLGVQLLEGRDVPATFVWKPELPPNTPVTIAHYSDLDNWLDGIGSTNHPTQLPGPLDDLIFIGNASTADCIIPAESVVSGNRFNSIKLLYGPSSGVGEIGSPPPPSTSPAYTGTVTLLSSFRVGTLEVQCGAIKQADQVGMNPTAPLLQFAGTLTVTTSLLWSGGTLNSNSVPGVIALAPGATGVAEPSYTNPGINQTVGLGSTIELLGTAVTGGNPEDPPAPPSTQFGSSLVLMSGDYNISNNAGFIVGSQSHLQLLPMPDDAPPPLPQPQPGGGNPPTYKAAVELKAVGDPPGNGIDSSTGTVNLNKDGTLTISPADRPESSTALARTNAPKGTIFNSGGTVILTDRVKAGYDGSMFSGYFLPGTPTPVEVNASVVQQSGLLSFQAGSQLVTSAGVVVLAGDLKCPGLGTDNSLKAVIEATDNGVKTYALILGPNATVSFPGSVTGTLELKGKFRWAGTVQVALSPLDTTLRDSITVTKEVEVVSAAKLKATWPLAFDADMADRDNGAAWKVVTSGVDDGITGVNASTPQLTLPTGTTITMAAELNLAKNILKVSKTSARVPK